MKRKWIGTILICVFVTACSGVDTINSLQAEAPSAADQPESKPKPQQVRVAAVGDIMMHNTQITAGKQPDGGYHFTPFFQEVAPFLKDADVTIGNLETTLPGEPYTGYPLFRSPGALADALREAGFHLMTTANNHTMDAGPQGVRDTYHQLKKSGLQPVGSAPSPEEQGPVFIEKNGITLSFAAYTYGTNGLPVPADQPYLVNVIDLEQIRKDIKYSREQGADWITVLLHFGQEYQREPNQEQRALVQQILDHGADAVLGSHPHVLQPMKRIDHPEGAKFVVYSLGNFISDQLAPHTNDGMILYLDLIRDKPDGPVRLEGASFIPTMVHKYPSKGERRFVVLPLTEEKPDMKYPALQTEAWQSSRERTTRHMTQWDTIPVHSPKPLESEHPSKRK
ncbi:CapA family protein [Desmospora profundinema]|uniref:Poly-gamma-glutamate synthesis protein (Capsule biosynthesis protein) n=1 Tax=Desmospora profundinema TaxID=1571184 RepID=A0ABU1IJF2_9BACL|nr:CapA family protein [Desmospora profundinema]MDR6224289.1 poly-gamma-glutamate synthesis protein (capsule biosynthesis protein) [Desmospora profundinema]